MVCCDDQIEHHGSKNRARDRVEADDSGRSSNNDRIDGQLYQTRPHPEAVLKKQREYSESSEAGSMSEQNQLLPWILKPELDAEADQIKLAA